MGKAQCATVASTVVLIATLVAPPAFAQKVYKCTTSSGTAYSQTPCGQTNQTVIEVDSKPPPWPWGEGRSGNKPKPTYTCKDAQGNWTEEACKPPEPPRPPPTQPASTRPAAVTQSSRIVSIGEEPKASPWDGVYYAVERHMEAAAHDPDSLKWEGCTKVIRSEIGWATRCDYRARNGFGALMKYKTLFIIRNDTVVATENIK